MPVGLDTPISISPNPTDPAQTFSIDPGSSMGEPVPMDIASQRAIRASLGFPSSSSYPDLYKGILDGMEEKLRKQYSSLVDEQKQSARSEIVSKIAASTSNADPQQLASMVERVMRRPKSMYGPLADFETDPKSVFEEAFSAEYVNNLRNRALENVDGWWKDADPEYAENALTAGREIVAKRQYILNTRENAEIASRNQSFLGDVLDRTKEVLPGYWQIKQRGRIPGSSSFSGPLLGENMEEQFRQLYRLPFPQFKEAWDKQITPFIKDNPHLAAEYATAALGMSSDDILWKSMLSAGDLPLRGGGVVGAYKLIRGTKEALLVDNAVKSVISKVGKVDGRAVIEEAAGNIEGAAKQSATTEFLKVLEGKDNPVKEALEGIPSAYKATIVKIEDSDLSRELKDRLISRLKDTAGEVIDTVINSIKVDRLPAVLAIQANIDKIIAHERGAFPGLENRILDIKIRPNPDAIVGGHLVDFTLGDEGAVLFKKIGTAREFAKTSGLGNRGSVVASEGQQGAGFYVTLSKPLSETDSVVRDAMLATAETLTPDSWLNAFGGLIGSLRTPEEVLSLQNRMNRKAATYGPANFFKLAQDIAKEIRDIKGWNLPFTTTRQKWTEWQSVIDTMKKTKNPEGHFILPDDPNEFRNVFQNKLGGRLPDDQEFAAYYAFKRGEDLQLSMMALDRFKNLHRTGAMTHTIKAEAETLKNGNIAYKEVQFDAVPLREYPTHSDTAIFIGNKTGREVLFDTGAAKSEFKKTLSDNIKEGKIKGFALSEPGNRPFSGFGKVTNQRVRYVFTAEADTKPLQWKAVKSRPADYDYEHYIKQARVSFDNISKNHWYEGDTIVGAFNIRAIGRDIAKRLDDIRQLIKDNKMAEAEAYHKANPLPMEFSEINSWFNPTKTAEGKTLGPRLNLEEPIQLVARNKKIIDLGKQMEEKYKGTFRDATRGGFGKLEERVDPIDIFSAENKGSVANPLYSIVPVKHLDPITSLNRSLNRTINSHFMNDYKIFSVEHWIQEAKDLLTAKPQELSEAPYYHFFNPVWKSVDGAQAIKKANLQTAAFQIRQFLGVESKTDTWLHAVGQKLADSIYEKYGPKYALVPTWALPKLKDPAGFLRSVAFHFKLGLFSLPQLWVQSQTFVTILGISGAKYALPGTKAAFLHQLSRMNKNPEILEALDRIASSNFKVPGTSRWLPGQFKEARQLLEYTGFGHVAGEHALRDNPMAYNIVAGPAETFLKWGASPFTAAERNVRYGAWYTAYREFREANPVGKISQADTRKILERADLLYTNMSKASNSTLHSGILSIPAQFYAYQLRLMELFMGKRLTQIERARLLGTFSLVYGVPAAFGVSGLPLGDWIRKWAQEDGYVVGDSYINTLLTEGLPALLGGLATGNYYNVGERYGIQGFGPLKDALRSDKTWWEVMGGAATSVVANFISRSDGFTAAMMSMFRDDNKAFPIKLEDFVDPFREISSVNNFARLWAALNTGKWMSKKEAYLTDVSKSNALFMFFSGLQPQEVSNVYTMTWTREQEKEAQKEGLNQFIREFRRGLANQEANSTQARDHFIRAFTYLKISGYPEEELPKAIALANKGHESVVNSTTWDFYTKLVPTERKDKARDALIRQKKLQGLQ